MSRDCCWTKVLSDRPLSELCGHCRHGILYTMDVPPILYYPILHSILETFGGGLLRWDNVLQFAVDNRSLHHLNRSRYYKSWQLRMVIVVKRDSIKMSMSSKHEHCSSPLRESCRLGLRINCSATFRTAKLCPRIITVDLSPERIH